MSAFYNEHDPYAARWLRNLIAAGHIAPGVVDERDIRDISPDDLAGFTQCHFFAGIGVWSAALRAAGWPDDRPVWTGSCPCQPFSAAGKGGGFDDERHLWPAFEWLVGQRRPDVVLGEQVEGPAGRAWLDVVLSDLEGHGYACGAAVFPAAGVGAPHMRHRTYWLADAPAAERGRCVGGLALPDGRQRDRLAGGEGCEPDRAARGRDEGDRGAAGDRAAGGLADADADGRDRLPAARLYGRRDGARGERAAQSGADGACRDDASRRGEARRLADAGLRSGQPGGMAGAPQEDERAAREQQRLRTDAGDGGARSRPGPTNGVWRDADWLLCRDDKWRPVEPGSFPLAHGVTSRVGRLRAYGNAIVLQAAQAFIESYLEIAG